MEKQAWIQAARQLAAQELPVQPLLRLPDAPDEPLQAALLQARGGVLADSAAAAIGCGVPDPRAVFLSADAPEDALRAAHGRCRYLAQTPEELQKLDALAGPLLPEGYLEDIAIRVWPRGGGAFTAENIPVFARLIRRTDNLAVRALFLPFDPEGDLSRQAKDAFSLVKKSVRICPVCSTPSASRGCWSRWPRATPSCCRPSECWRP